MTSIIMVDGTAIPLGGPRGPAGPDGSPIGTVISFMGSAAPEDYLVCDGGVHNIAEYPDLAEFFRKQFGAANHFGGDGETNFAVPTVQGTEAAMLSCIKARTSASAEDVYSLEERIVGRWIDGRPLYRKTILFADVGIAGGAYGNIFTDKNIDNIVFGSWSGSYLNVSVINGPMFKRDDGSVEIKNIFTSSQYNFSGTATIEYIKTTDQPTIPLPEMETDILQEDWPGAAEDEIVSEEI
ncbi:MAG: tail fiber protein [Lawsonibacter sp.]|nr:tail fiber protein [Lawsonibacter sp.]